MAKKIDVLKDEMEYIAQQNNPYLATGGGLRYLCNLRNVEYSDDEPDDVIRDRLLKEINKNTKNLTDLEIELNILKDIMEQPQMIIDEKNGIYQKVDLTDTMYYQIGRVLKAYENQQDK